MYNDTLFIAATNMVILPFYVLFRTVFEQMHKMKKYGAAVSVRPHVSLQKPVNEFNPNLACHILHFKFTSDFIFRPYWIKYEPYFALS
jgi:hypothetical protein